MPAIALPYHHVNALQVDTICAGKLIDFVINIWRSQFDKKNNFAKLLYIRIWTHSQR